MLVILTAITVSIGGVFVCGLIKLYISNSTGHCTAIMPQPSYKIFLMFTYLSVLEYSLKDGVNLFLNAKVTI